MFAKLKEELEVHLHIEELDSIAVDSEQRTAKFMVLKQTAEHQVEEEEGEVFKKAGEILDKERLRNSGPDGRGKAAGSKGNCF